ncbi:hypothetical protein GCM10027048_34310 [Hymenobacter coalescens]
MPDACLLLAPDLVIEAVSDAYLAITQTHREALVGRSLFEVFPEQTPRPGEWGLADLRASLAQVLATGRPHDMARQRRDVPNPAMPGTWMERHWLVRNTPVLDEQGQVSHLLHTVQDATAQVQTEVQLHSSQAREHAALTEMEIQRSRLQLIVDQAPTLMAVLEGPEHRIQLASEVFQQMFGNRALLGKPLREALIELRGQPFFGLLDAVYRTGEAQYGREVLAYIDRDNSGRRVPVYFNFTYRATCNATGQVGGVLVMAHDVSELVQARQRAEAQAQHTQLLNEELAAANAEMLANNRELRQVQAQVQQLNKELQAANAEFLANNAELSRTQLRLRRLNDELEAHVVERTREVQAARTEAEAQRARLERLFMQAPAAICILNGPDLVFELVNPSYQRLLPNRPLLGRSFLEAVPELARHSVMEVFQRVYQTGFTHEESAILVPLARDEDGVLEDRYFNYIQQARYDEQNRIDGVLVFAFEVTEQVRARQASEAVAHQLRLITDALPVLIGYLDHDQRYRFANHAYQAWFQQPPEALLGRSVREVVGEQAYQGVLGYIERALAGERLDFEARMPYREGFTKYIRTSYVPDVQDGRVAGFFTLVTDVTEQVEARQQVEAANAELAAANEQLTRTNQDLDNFVYAASHDLKQPVNNLRGLFDELHRCVTFADPAEEQLLLPLVQDALDHLSVTIDDLAALGQAQRVSAIPAETVSLAELTEEVLSTLEPQVRAARARITTDFAARPTIRFPRANLRTVLLNLLGNSLKYADPQRPARVHLSVWVEDEQPVLVVEDNGLGFDAARYRSELFQLFRRLHHHTPGSGVGLYLVNRIVQANGGSIEVESEEGAGATFRVRLGQA